MPMSEFTPHSDLLSSPAPSQIEHLCWKLKQIIYELSSHLEDEGASVEAREAFEAAAQEA
jgi:hypothetical protein